MPQVITPPSVGYEEEASKNWYRAEALRKITNDLVNLVSELPEGSKVLEPLRAAVVSISSARKILNPDQQG